MQLTTNCVCRARRSGPTNGESVPWRCAAAVPVPRGLEASLPTGLWAAPFHAAAFASTSASLALARGPTAAAAAPARVAATATSVPEPAESRPLAGLTPQTVSPSGWDSDRDDSPPWLEGNVGAGITGPDSWRDPGQTLSLEASTSPSSSRTLVPVLRRPRRATTMPSSSPPPPAAAAAAVAPAPAASPPRHSSPAAAGDATAQKAEATAAASTKKAAATTRAAARAAKIAKWKARAAAAAVAAAAAAAAVATGAPATGTPAPHIAGPEPVNPEAAVAAPTTPELQPPSTPMERRSGSSPTSMPGSGGSSNSGSSTTRLSPGSRGEDRAAGAPADWRPLEAAAAAAGAPPPSEPPTAAVLQLQLKRMRRSGRLAEALDLSYRGMSCYPLVRSFWASAASLELRIGRVAAARGLLDRGLRRWPGNAALLLGLGQLHASQRDYDAAADAFRAALEREPGNAAVLHAWAMAEAARGDLATARSRFRAARLANPDMAHSYTSWARLEAAAGDEATARQLFQEGHEADPSHVPLLHAWATFELDHDKQSAARRLLDRALELNPHHVPSWMAMGTLEWRQGNPAKAREVFEQAVSVVGPSPPLISALAGLELRLVNIKNARELFARLRGTTPGHVPALLSEAKMEHIAGNRVRAQQLYGEAAAAVAAGVVRGSEGGELQPLQLESADERSTSHQARGQGQQSAQGSAGGGAAAATPSSTAVLQAWAQSHLCNGDLATAEQLLLAIEAVEPTNGHLCHTRGLLCQREGALEAAERWFRRGLDCRTSRDGALLCYEGLAELLAFLGRKEEARAAWQAGAAAVPTATSRFLRQAALFEKKEGNATQAAVLFADSVRRDPQDYRSWLQWGVFESRQRNWDAAERCFQRGTAVAPGYPYMWLSYVSSLVAQRRIPDARLVLQSATRHCPHHAQLYMEWALLEAAAGDADTARRLFIKGADVPPRCQHEPLYQAWAAFETEMGNRDAAAPLLKHAELVTQASRTRRLAADKEQGLAAVGGGVRDTAAAGNGGGAGGTGPRSRAAVSA